jgi:cholesterol transport system auxiliary component
VSWLLVAAVLGGCALPDKPRRANLYDFGPGELSATPATPPDASFAALPTARPTTQSAALPRASPAGQSATPQLALPPLAIADITTAGGALDNQAVLYRLAYTDAQQLRPYSQARWSMPPALLVRQRLRERLSRERTVFNAREGVALNRSQHVNLPLLRLELEEFSQLFSTPETSVGLVRLRATLLEITPAGEKLIAQRAVVVQRPATSADAPGGVRALTAATDAAIDELDQWLRQTPLR